MRALAAGAAASPTWVESLTALARQQAHSQAAQAAIAAQDWTPRVLTPHQNEPVVALTELIIPQTDTPGAKAAQVNRFIDHVLQRRKPADRDSFVRGLTWIDDAAAPFSQGFRRARRQRSRRAADDAAAEGDPNKGDARHRRRSSSRRSSR